MKENSYIGFCNNRHGQHISSNIVNSDGSIIMTDYHTKATGSDNIQTYSYINNENRGNIIHQHKQKTLKKIANSIVKHIQGWHISSKLDNKHEVYVR